MHHTQHLSFVYERVDNERGTLKQQRAQLDPHHHISIFVTKHLSGGGSGDTEKQKTCTITESCFCWMGSGERGGREGRMRVVKQPQDIIMPNWLYCNYDAEGYKGNNACGSDTFPRHFYDRSEATTNRHHLSWISFNRWTLPTSI